MNRRSFLDELIKLGGVRRAMEKLGYLPGYAMDPSTVDIPHAMIGSEPVPPAIELKPDDASTRVPRSVLTLSVIRDGALGQVTPAKDPIDKERFNRVFWVRK